MCINNHNIKTFQQRFSPYREREREAGGWMTDGRETEKDTQAEPKRHRQSQRARERDTDRARETEKETQTEPERQRQRKRRDEVDGAGGRGGSKHNSLNHKQKLKCCVYVMLLMLEDISDP